MIQARYGSTRLPGKVLMDLLGKTILERMVDRVKNSKCIDEVMVLTSLNIEDVQIVRLASSIGLRVFAGNALDVLDRYYQAAKLIKPEYIIRLTADCPVFDAKILDSAIEQLDSGTDYLSMNSETFPDGLDLEIIKFSALEQAWQSSKLASEREHVTLYIKNNKNLFKIQDFVCPFGNLGNQRWTIDEPEDYEMIRKLYEHFAPNVLFGLEQIYSYLCENPEIARINSMHMRNEGLQKSLVNDYIIDNSTKEKTFYE
jgi:spore coat polysaccharide biosynthesis protein SpsF (cytidylyltransferase family)